MMIDDDAGRGMRGSDAIERSNLEPADKQRALAVLASFVTFYESSRERWTGAIDFDFLAEVIMRLAVSESVRRALAGDPEWGSWFEDDRHYPMAPGSEGAVDETFGFRRVEAARTLERVGDAKVRAAATEAVGTALQLHMFGHVAPAGPQDCAFLAEAAVHAFSSPDVVSCWGK